MRSVSPAEGSYASTFTVPNLGRHPHHQRVKLHVGAAKQDGWTRRGPRPQSLRDGGDSNSADPLPMPPPRGSYFRSHYRPLPRRCPTLPNISPCGGDAPQGQRGSASRLAGGEREPPPQSLRDSSPSGGAISDRWESDSADHSMWSTGGERGGQPELRGGLPLSRCATAPPRGERFPTDGNRIPLTTQCGQRGESVAVSGGLRGVRARRA